MDKELKPGDVVYNQGVPWYVVFLPWNDGDSGWDEEHIYISQTNPLEDYGKSVETMIRTNVNELDDRNTLDSQILAIQDVLEELIMRLAGIRARIWREEDRRTATEKNA